MRVISVNPSHRAVWSERDFQMQAWLPPSHPFPWRSIKASNHSCTQRREEVRPRDADEWMPRLSFNELLGFKYACTVHPYTGKQSPLENSSSVSLKSSMCEIIFRLQKQTSGSNLQCDLLIKLD